MSNRYSAYTVEETLAAYDNMKIYDIFSISWADFTFPNGYTNHAITADETQKPYLIIYREFGTTDYWDVLLLINGVDDILNLQAGDILKIPKQGDIETFIRGQLTA